MKASDFYTMIRVSQDPWAFLTEFVKTQDPARGVAAFPDYPYLHDLMEATLQERLLLVPKSRQMLVTWSMVALSVWRALFRDAGLYLFLSRNERCAEELIDRARFIVSHLPPYMQPRLTVNSREEIAFGKYGARILSLPASANGPRMYSPSGVFWDEMAFTPYDEQIWAALKPALDSGGTFAGVSSSGGANNLFARFVLATLDDSAARGKGTPRGETRPLFLHEIGKEEKRTNGSAPGSPFHVHRVHYLDHPGRQTEEWKQMAAAGLSQTRWRLEQEISFESMSDLVYSEFDPQKHILAEEWTVRPEWDLYRTIDFGYRHPFVLWIQRTPEDEFIVFDEWQGSDRTTEEMVIAIRNIDFAHGVAENDMVWSACDPAGEAKQDTGLSPVDILRRAGLKVRNRPSRIATGVEYVKSMLTDGRERVRLRISPRCTNLIADFGRYRWAPTGDEPVKDGLCDHSMDALRYFFVNYESTADEMPYAPRMCGVGR
ncbi:MAG TPA: hypothetical protein VGL38_06545 [bacterium]|jgi:hypothetical protein